MASVVTSPSPATSTVSMKFVSSVSETAATVNATAARELLRMGRAATVPAGINWLTLVVVILFHVGALAAFFFFTWQRLAVMALLYVLAINVGIGMCYHRLLGWKLGLYLFELERAVRRRGRRLCRARHRRIWKFPERQHSRAWLHR